MKKKLTVRETVTVTSMLFGMFFGAGNLIFPAILGKEAGSNMLPAYIGLFITAVGLPMLAVVSLASSRSEGVFDMAGHVGKGYGMFYTIALYLTLGPFFATPRCASVPTDVGLVMLSEDSNVALYRLIFSILFFAVMLAFSLRPSGILTWIGEILNPVFLVFLAVLVITALCDPINSVSSVIPAEKYATAGGALLSGFLEGYGTLDALAGLAFGIIVIDVIRKQKVENPGDIAANASRAGIFSCVFMGIIYFFITLMCTQSSGIFEEGFSGAQYLGAISNHYFGAIGSVLMTLIVTLACLKTAIGLTTATAEVFVKMFPKGPSYKVWTVIFTVISLLIANLGLSTIVAYCVPVLMFLYPLTITVILLCLFGKYFGFSKPVFVFTTVFTFIPSLLDFIGTLSGTLEGSSITPPAFFGAITGFASKYLPLFDMGLGWICPAVLGFAIGFVIYLARRKKA